MLSWYLNWQMYCHKSGLVCNMCCIKKSCWLKYRYTFMNLIYCRTQFFWGNRLSNDILKKNCGWTWPKFPKLNIGQALEMSVAPWEPCCDVCLSVCLLIYKYSYWLDFHRLTLSTRYVYLSCNQCSMLQTLFTLTLLCYLCS